MARAKFDKFVHEHGRKYDSVAEHERRFAIFKENLDIIAKHNTEGHSWKMGINKFTDMTDAEYQAGLTYITPATPGEFSPYTPKSKMALEDLPAEVDWRTKGALTPVKDQGSCGSCWAFATAAMVESYAYLTNQTLVQLSTQQVTSCTPNELMCGGLGGCMGNIVQYGLLYTQLFGLVKESEYPYVSGHSGQSEQCIYDPKGTPPSATVMGYELLPRNNYEAVMNHLATVGPLAVGMDASNWGRYDSGVFNGCDFDSNIGINHAIQLVGYGTDATEGDYWIVRNSWGPGWGEDGFIRMARNNPARCGVNSTPLSGVACVNDGQESQNVCGICGLLFDVSYPIGATLL